MRTLIVLGAVLAALIVGAASTLADPAPYQRPGKTELVSLANDGRQARPDPSEAFYEGVGSDMSANGRYVLFGSDADHLVAGDTNLVPDVFVRDRVKRRTVRVSTSSSDGQAVAPKRGRGSYPSAISADGRYVVFSSDAVNLVPGDTNLAYDVFLKDLKSGNTTRVSVGENERQTPLLADSYPADVSNDGRYVTFSTRADGLVRGDANGLEDVFARDMRLGRTHRVSVGLAGAESNQHSGGGSLSADGRYVAFTSYASNLVANDRNGAEDAFRRDLKTGRTLRVSVASDGTEASFSYVPCGVGSASDVLCTTEIAFIVANRMSADGRFVTFSSTATNLVPNDTNFRPFQSGLDSFVHDAVTGRTERVSVDSFGHESTTVNTNPQVISADGRYVAIADIGPVQSQCALPVEPAGLCPLEALARGVNASLFDRLTGAREVLAPSTSRTRYGPCSGAERALGRERRLTHAFAVSPGGRYVSFGSSRTDLVRGDTNERCDVFVRDRGSAITGEILSGAQSSQSPPAPGTCILGVCPAVERDADLLGVRVARRPALQDLFVRWDLRTLKLTSLSSAPGVIYGLDFNAGGVRYQIRAQRVSGPDFDQLGGASFGLFRESLPGVWTKVSSLEGGYGTVGDAVVTAVPLSLLGGNARLTDVTAYTAVGSYMSGAIKVLDSLELTR